MCDLISPHVRLIKLDEVTLFKISFKTDALARYYWIPKLNDYGLSRLWRILSFALLINNEKYYLK